MRRSVRFLLAALALTLEQCAENEAGPGLVGKDVSPMFDSTRYAAVSARLRDSFVLHDTAFCDSVLPLFDDTALARIHPGRVVDGFVSDLIGHDAPQPDTRKRFDELVVYSGAAVMRNWRDYVEARALQNAGARQQAIAAFEPLLARFEEDHDTVGIASVSKRIGSLYLDLGDPSLAAVHLLRARTLEPRVDLRSSITATLGRCYALTGNGDSVRWCAARLREDAVNALNVDRRDERATVNAQWLLHLAMLLEPARDSLHKATAQASALDALVGDHDSHDGFLVASEPGARVETLVLRAKALLRLRRVREAISALGPAEEELARCTECLPQRLAYLSVHADALADLGDLRGALHVQQERAEVLALNEVGRERLAVEQARAKALSIEQEAEADRRLEQERAGARRMDIEHRMQRVLLMAMIGFVILFAGVLFVQARVRRRMQLEQLRARLSRDLHDDIGSTLSSINILSAVARRKAEAGDEAGAAASLTGISERTQRLMRNMSDIVWSVDPEQDSMEDLLARMREFGAAVLEAKGISFRFDGTGALHATLPPLVKSDLYLIFKEAVNNAAKHAQATEVTASFTHGNNRLRMTIADNGRGLDTSGPASGMMGGNGLRNMHARSAEMKADLRVRGTPGQGTTIDLVVPL
ncbi:MAG: hypothetical protein JST66_13745 [Bacteroidetes bacterium]|nr:hypothetical protein [Bacteroidota bacterium]